MKTLKIKRLSDRTNSGPAWSRGAETDRWTVARHGSERVIVHSYVRGPELNRFGKVVLSRKEAFAWLVANHFPLARTLGRTLRALRRKP